MSLLVRRMESSTSSASGPRPAPIAGNWTDRAGLCGPRLLALQHTCRAHAVRPRLAPAVNLREARQHLAEPAVNGRATPAG